MLVQRQHIEAQLGEVVELAIQRVGGEAGRKLVEAGGSKQGLERSSTLTRDSKMSPRLFKGGLG